MMETAEKLTVEDVAAEEFTPWQDRSITLPDTEDMRELRETLSIALGLLYQGKTEIMAAVKKMGPEAAMGAVGAMDYAADLLDEMKGIAEAASARTMIAMAAVTVELEAEGLAWAAPVDNGDSGEKS